jgi:hypothetical protein
MRNKIWSDLEDRWIDKIESETNDTFENRKTKIGEVNEMTMWEELMQKKLNLLGRQRQLEMDIKNYQNSITSTNTNIESTKQEIKELDSLIEQAKSFVSKQ